MRTEFEILKKEFAKVNYGQPMAIAMDNLEKKIIEIEKRLECARRCNLESNSIVVKMTETFEGKGAIEDKITYGEFETLARGVYDVDIALNFNNNEPITENWYGLFKPKRTIETEVPHGTIVDDIRKTFATETILLEPPSIPNQCKNQHTFDKVKEVIQILKTLDNGDCVDGETMQYILQQVGMTDQMLRQLVMSNPESDTKDLLEEKKELNNKSVRGCIEI